MSSNIKNLGRGPIRSSPKYALGPCLNFDIIDLKTEESTIDILVQHIVLLRVLHLAVHLKKTCQASRGDYPETLLPFGFICENHPSCLKVDFSVCPSPLVTDWAVELGLTGLGLGLGGSGTKGLGLGLDNLNNTHKIDLLTFSFN